MAKQSTLSGSSKSIAGAAFVGLVSFVLMGNLDGVASQLICPLGTTEGDALNLLPSVVLVVASHALQSCVFNRKHFFQAFNQMLVSCWLLLFVIAAAFLLRAAFKAKVGVFPELSKYFGE